MVIRVVRSLVGAALCAAIAVSSSVSAGEVRTWSDATGKFKIEASFVSEADGTVTLEKADGEEIELPLKKLSVDDQKMVAKLKADGGDGENPFGGKPKDPFKSKPKNKTKPSNGDADDGSSAGGGGKELTVDWSDSEAVSLVATDEWKVTPPAATGELALPEKIKTVSLPAKNDFFESISTVCVNADAKKAVVGYQQGHTNKGLRLVICDLTTGKAGPAASAPDVMIPLSLHDDGETVLMCRAEFGFGNSDRLEIWNVKGKKITRQSSFIPYSNIDGSGHDVTWGRFLGDDRLITNSRSGRVTVWNWRKAQPIFHIETCDGSAPSISPDGKLLAFCTGDAVGILNLDNHDLVAMQPTPAKMQWPGVAFSPSGKRIACVAFDKVVCWEVETGKLVGEIPANGSQFNGRIDFPSEDFVFVNGQYLLDVVNQLQVWHYHDASASAATGEWGFFAVADGQKSAALIPTKLPHGAALAVREKALKDTNLFVFKPGTVVKLDISGLPDPALREKAMYALIERIKAAGCSVGADGTIDVVAAISGPKSRDISYFGSGDYKVQEWIASVKLMYQGKDAWAASSSNVPFFIQLKKGENIEQHLRASEKPPYGFFDGVQFPKFVQRPGGNSRGGQTMGDSSVTISGIK